MHYRQMVLGGWFLCYNDSGISGIPKRRVSAMAVATTLQIRSKGTVTLPIELRRKYGLGEGDIITLIGLGEGSLLLTPIVTQVNRLGDRISRVMAEEGVSMDEILTALDEEREVYYQGRFVQD